MFALCYYGCIVHIRQNYNENLLIPSQKPFDLPEPAEHVRFGGCGLSWARMDGQTADRLWGFVLFVGFVLFMVAAVVYVATVVVAAMLVVVFYEV